ncbi:hypothetical protein WMY93_030448 [Mugilogobius chulae]|uniref:Contactin 3a, tandem duplicate 1 n=1 Tax=Mugilogobius chulae TaxID=88201 RepID=A0AAW0MNE0_9GOBI
MEEISWNSDEKCRGFASGRHDRSAVLLRPVFTKQPGSVVFPLKPGEDQREVVFSCEAQGHPPPIYRWKLNDSFILPRPGSRYSLMGGNLHITHLNKDEDVGIYQCLASNSFGTAVSREASLHIAYLENFKTQRRNPVRVREGQGVVLLCGPPPHSGEVQAINYCLNEQIGLSVRLECFYALNTLHAGTLNPRSFLYLVLSPFLSRADIRASCQVIKICNLILNCHRWELVGHPSRGETNRRIDKEDVASQDVQMTIDETLVWDCKASAKPKPSYRWLKNGEALDPMEDRLQVNGGVLTISSLNLADIGMYQCVAENKHGRVFTNAELRVIAIAPDFSQNLLKTQTLARLGGDILIECKPRMSPRGVISWRKGKEALRESHRVTVLETGSLRISNVTKMDAGLYTCVARNQFGVASSAGSLLVKEPTSITSPAGHLDVTVGESIVLPCQVSHDPTLELKFTWFFNEQLIHFGSHGAYFEKVGGRSAGDIMIRNIQLRHAGKYTCAVQTKVDSVSIATDVVVRGPPGPPVDCQVTEVTETAASVSWGPGQDNHSPILSYAIQARSPFSLGWQAVTTVPERLGGKQLSAAVTDLNPWVEYEFRVLATNSIGTGEPAEHPNAPAPKRPPVPEEMQSGPGFGYVVAFRPLGAPGWMQAAVTSPDASRYVFKNESIPPFSPYQVKVGVYNNKGEGPFSPVTTIHSAEEEPSRAPGRLRARSLSASEVEVTWKPLAWSNNRRRILGYEEKQDTARVMRTVGNRTAILVRDLDGSSTYSLSLRAYNSAGVGPPSNIVNVTTKKPPPSQAISKIMWNTSNSKVILKWDQVHALENESEVTGYKVMYSQDKHSSPSVVETNTTSLELSLPVNQDYVIQIKPFSEGGEGSSSRQITIPKIAGSVAMGSASQSVVCPLLFVALLLTVQSIL